MLLFSKSRVLSDSLFRTIHSLTKVNRNTKHLPEAFIGCDLLLSFYHQRLQLAFYFDFPFVSGLPARQSVYNLRPDFWRYAPVTRKKEPTVNTLAPQVTEPGTNSELSLNEVWHDQRFLESLLHSSTWLEFC